MFFMFVGAASSRDKSWLGILLVTESHYRDKE